jgi:hypothetical protein
MDEVFISDKSERRRLVGSNRVTGMLERGPMVASITTPPFVGFRQLRTNCSMGPGGWDVMHQDV